jgi:hypothetical protein
LYACKGLALADLGYLTFALQVQKGQPSYVFYFVLINFLMLSMLSVLVGNSSAI